MNDDLDFDALVREWQQVDTQIGQLAEDTRRLQRWAHWEIWFMWTLFAVSSVAAVAAPIAIAQDGAGPAVAAGVALYGTPVVVGFGVYTWRHGRRLSEADAQLLGGPASVVRGRMQLLQAELTAWVGPTALLMMVWAVPIFCAAPIVVGSVAGPAAALVLVVGLLAFYTHGYRRVPRLRAELAELEALAESLEDPDHTDLTADD